MTKCGYFMFNCGCLLRTPSCGCLLRTPSCGCLLGTPSCGCLLRPCSSGYSTVGVYSGHPALQNIQLWVFCYWYLTVNVLITNPEWQTPSCGSLMTSTQLVVKWQTPNCRCLWQMTVSRQMLDWLLGDRCLTVHDRWLVVWWQMTSCLMTIWWQMTSCLMTNCLTGCLMTNCLMTNAWLAAWWQAVWWQMLDWIVQVLHQEILTQMPVLVLQQTLNSLCLLGTCVL